MATNKFIGSGIIFPIIINDQGRPDYYNNSKLIESSLLCILNWPIKTRFFNSTFGSRIHELLDEPNDDIAASLLKFFILESVETWDKRVEVKSIAVRSFDLYKVEVTVNYQITSTLLEETFTFPYYKI